VPGQIDLLQPHRRAGGDIRQMELSAQLIDFDGQAAVLVLAIDVTERKALEGQLKQAQKLESIGQLAAGIAHEINTTFLENTFREVCGVLTAYRTDPAAGAEAAAAADLDYLQEEVPRAIRQTLEGIQHVSRIVKAMKEFAHPGTTEKTPVDLNKALETVITVARNEWKYVAELTTHFDPDLPVISGLPGELNQVFLNLLVNAAHAVKSAAGADGAKGVITLTTRKLRGAVEVSVSDSGGGIPEAIRERIFDPFFTTKPVGQGTGQGLSIAHAVVEQKHGGAITFETEVGKGTTFVVRLPINGERLTHSKRIQASETAHNPRPEEVTT
jgi:signal transduction histidine kinase